MAPDKQSQSRTPFPAAAPPVRPRPFHGTRRIQVDPFFQVPLYSQPASCGDVQLPLLVQDCSVAYVVFVARRERVESLLKGTSLDPAMVLDSRALVALSLYQYRQTTVGALQNISLAIPVVRRTGFKRPSSWREIRMTSDRRHMGFYLTDSALDSRVMLSAGQDIWGYPKFLADIRTQIDGTKINVEVNDADRRRGILRLTGSGARLTSLPCIDLTMYTIRGNELLRSLINSRGRFNFQMPLGFRLEVGNSAHPMAERLRFLDLDNARPLGVFSCEDYQGRMNGGVTVDLLER